MHIKTLLSTLALTSMLASSAGAADLGLSLDDFLKSFGDQAKAAGVTLTPKEIRCLENPNPRDATKKIMSCAHSLGGRKMIISNSQPGGPLIDISVSSWEGGNNGPAAIAITWIASTLNGKPAADYTDAANKAVKDVAEKNYASIVFGKGDFTIFAAGKKLTISITPIP